MNAIEIDSTPAPAYSASDENKTGHEGHQLQEVRGPQEVGQASGTPPRMVTPLDRLGENPDNIDCPFCHRQTQTRVQQEHSSMTMYVPNDQGVGLQNEYGHQLTKHSIAGVVIGLFCICLACVPCLMHAFPDTDYYCSSCGAKVAHRPQGGQIQVMRAPASAQVPSQYAAGEQMVYPNAPQKVLQK